MGWNPLDLIRTRGVLLAALFAAGLALTGARVNAATISNGFISVSVSDTGAIGITSLASGRTIVNPTKTSVFIRIDDGLSNLANLVFNSGWDDTLGGSAFTYGSWVQAPAATGNHITAKYLTGPILRVSGNGGGTNGGTNGGGGGNGFLILGYTTEIDLTVNLVHDSARFEFNVINVDQGLAHKVSLAFIQDTESVPAPTAGDGPIQVSSGGTLHRETEYDGSLAVPTYWESYVSVKPTSAADDGDVQSIRGTLKPSINNATEPTPPTRFIYGRIDRLTGTDVERLNNLGLFDIPPYSLVWNLVANPSIVLDKAVGTGPHDAGVGLYWDGQVLASGESKPLVTYIGTGTADIDFTPPVTLSVSSRRAFKYLSGTVGASATTTTATITASVQNTSDLLPSGGLPLSSVSLFLDLPKGLVLDNDVSTKTLSNITPGQEASVSWNVKPDTTAGNQVTGVVKFSVAASPSFGASKLVSRTIEIPAIKQYSLVPGFQMLSLPFNFAGAAPSTILTLNAANFQIVRWNPLKNRYELSQTIEPGFAYWVQTATAVTNPITGGTPIDPQIGANVNVKSIAYPKGWNQIGNPTLYGIRFSEIQVLDTDSLQVISIQDASDSQHQWVLPAVYTYDTVQKTYVVQNDFGFVMQPYVGYWLKVLKPTLQFIYPGVATPDTFVQRSANLSRQTVRGTANNWKLRLVARGKDTADVTNYVGVATRASDGPDIYKLDKPPTLDKQVALNIVHTDWADRSGAFAQDLRSAALTTKTWNLQVVGQPNEDITLTWPEYGTSVPRDYQLTLVDGESSTRRLLKNLSSYTVNVGKSGTRNLSIIAEPTRAANRLQITNFAVVTNSSRAAGSGPSSVVINYGLSGASDAQIVIRDGRGHNLRTLAATTRAAAGGSNAGSAVWDLRDQRGAALPPGAYNIELVAVGEGGQRSRQLLPFTLVR